MRVLLVSSLTRGGPLEQTVVLAAGLAERGVSVHATCASPAIAHRLEEAGVRAEVLPQRRGPDIRAGTRIWRRMRTVDVVHAQDRRSGLWVRLAPGERSVARVYTVHGLPDPYLPHPVGHKPSRRDRLAYEFVDAGLCRRADAVVIPSAALAQAFCERLRFPADRIQVVPNGVELPDGVRAANGSTGRNRVVGTLSLLEPVKDVSTFLTAASLLAPDHPDLQFVVFGDGPERAPLIERAHELGIADRVTFPGYVDRDVAFRRLDVFVLPSIIENSPMVLLEAMARGVPVVASRSGGIPEITAGDTALLAEPGDAPAFAKAIARLLYDREFANRLAAAALARIAAKYTSSRNADAMIKIYEAALDRRRCR